MLEERTARMFYRVMTLIFVLGILASAVPGSAAPGDECSPDTVIASFAEADKISEWVALYSACPLQTQLAVRQLATGYQLLRSESLPFAAADDATLFNSIWTWYQGSSVSMVYGLDAEQNIVSLIADEMTVQQDTVTTAPVLAYGTNGDLSARVKVDFAPLYDENGAGIGIRDAQDPNQWIRISREGSTIVVSKTENGTTTEVASQPYEEGETVVYLRITRAGSLFALSYSVDGEEWRDVAVNESINFSGDIEVFVTTYSPDEVVTLAQFSEMRIE